MPPARSLDPTSRVSVVLLSHNRPGMLPRALDSVLAQTYPLREILVVDNPSQATPELRAMVRARPPARFLENAENLGFAGGMNVGLNAVSGSLVYLTEDDLVLEPDCIARLVEHFERTPGAAMASGTLVSDTDGSTLFAGGSFTVGRNFGMELPGRGKPLEAPGAPRRIGYLPGGSALADVALLRKLGGFRADFFMYFEDVELCARILRAGRSLWVVPEAKVLHLDPPPAPKGAIHPFAFHKHKNLLAFYLLHAPSSVLPSFYARHGPLALARALMSDRRVASIQLRGWAWFLRHLPGLLRDRRKITRETEQPLT